MKVKVDVDIENFLERNLRDRMGGPVKIDEDLASVSVPATLEMVGEDMIIYLKYHPQQNKYSFRIYTERPKS